MIPLSLTLSLSPPPLLSPFPLSKLRPATRHESRTHFMLLRKKQLKLRGRGICRAELQQDAPFAIAIGACMLNSLLFPYTGVSSEEDEDAAISPTDARFTVMNIISFIPYFNWLSWIFALIDTGNRRYAVYAIVYLAPYLRTNLSLSPDESWLPIASIVLCIVHIQLEASIRSGDIDGFNFFNEAAKRLGLVAGKKGKNQGKRHDEGRRQNNMNLPSGQEQSMDEIRKRRVPRKPSQDLEHVNEDDDLDDGTKH